MVGIQWRALANQRLQRTAAVQVGKKLRYGMRCGDPQSNSLSFLLPSSREIPVIHDFARFAHVAQQFVISRKLRGR